MYAINQTTLVSWQFVQHRIIISLFIGRLNGSKIRLEEEIVSRMQGLELPAPSLCSSSSLPPSYTLPLVLPPLSPPPLSYVFVEPKDTTGQAVLLRRVRPTLTTSTVVRTADASSVSSTPPLAVREEVQTSVLRSRRVYHCGECGKV